MSHDAFLKWLDTTTKIVLLVGGLVGGLFTGWQYLESKQAKRVERTFAFFDKLQQGDAAQAREAVSTELRRQLPELARIRATAMTPAAAATVHAQLVSGLVHDSHGGRGLSVEIDRLLDHFEQIQVCIEKSLCDGDTARTFLGSYARTLWDNFRPYIVGDQRQAIPGYGAGLERFVKKIPERTTP